MLEFIETDNAIAAYKDKKCVVFVCHTGDEKIGLTAAYEFDYTRQDIKDIATRLNDFVNKFVL
jgi:hypothetical protein